MLRRAIPIVVVSAFLGGCTAHHKPANTQGTLADLQKVAPDVKDADTKQSKASIRPWSTTGNSSMNHRKPR